MAEYESEIEHLNKQLAKSKKKCKTLEKEIIEYKSKLKHLQKAASKETKKRKKESKRVEEMGQIMRASRNSHSEFNQKIQRAIEGFERRNEEVVAEMVEWMRRREQEIEHGLAEVMAQEEAHRQGLEGIIGLCEEPIEKILELERNYMSLKKGIEEKNGRLADKLTEISISNRKTTRLSGKKSTKSK